MRRVGMEFVDDRIRNNMTCSVRLRYRCWLKFATAAKGSRSTTLETMDALLPYK